MRRGAGQVLLASVFLVTIASRAIAVDLPDHDVPGSKDSSLLARYHDARIIAYDQSDDEEASLPSGPFRDFAFTKTIKLEGQVTRIAYVFPEKLSTIAVMNHYRDVLKGAGFKVLFQCAGGDGCGGFNFGEALTQPMAESHGGDQGNRIIDFLHPVGGDIRYVLATLDRPTGSVTLALAVARHTDREPGLFVETVEQLPPNKGPDVADAAQIASALRVHGHVVLSGIHFAPGKATVQPNSRAALTQVAKMLRGDPSIRLLVVGHSDSSEPLAQGVQLSTDRAQAVMRALTGRWKIPPAQVGSMGIGPAAPIASNADADGRTLNQRIELVLQ